jgi:hypothetical protein
VINDNDEVDTSNFPNKPGVKGAGPDNSLFQNLQISYGLIKKMKSHTKKISEN